MRVFSNAGDTALVLLVPEAEAAVHSWRATHDPSAAEGMPAHITVSYPFVAERTLNDETVADVAAVCRELPPVAVVFREFGAFPCPGEGPPRVLWLTPDSAECHMLLATFGSRRPAGRRWPIVPHLTITDGADAAVIARAEADVATHMPLKVLIAAVSLMAFDGDTWVCRHQFRLAGEHR